ERHGSTGHLVGSSPAGPPPIGPGTCLLRSSAVVCQARPVTMPSAETYFVAHGNDRYEPTEHAGGAWRDDELHLAPVSGLITHHLERLRERHVDASLRFSRITFEALGQ